MGSMNRHRRIWHHHRRRRYIAPLGGLDDSLFLIDRFDVSILDRNGEQIQLRVYDPAANQNILDRFDDRLNDRAGVSIQSR
jgi:hypothetical protein